MKGVVFTEFLAAVEQQHGAATLEEVIDDAQLASQAAYTAVGTYDHDELLRMVAALAQRTDQTSADILKGFGRRVFACFAASAGPLLARIDGPFELLAAVEGLIHAEVRRLDERAEPPRLAAAWQNSRDFEVIYRSKRPLADLAEGVIRACLDHFGVQAELIREDLPGVPGTAARFTLSPVMGGAP